MWPPCGPRRRLRRSRCRRNAGAERIRVRCISRPSVADCRRRAAPWAPQLRSGRRDSTVSEGCRDGLEATVDTEFLKEILDVIPYRGATHRQSSCHGHRAQTCTHQREHFALAPRQAVSVGLRQFASERHVAEEMHHVAGTAASVVHGQDRYVDRDGAAGLCHGVHVERGNDRRSSCDRGSDGFTTRWRSIGPYSMERRAASTSLCLRRRVPENCFRGRVPENDPPQRVGDEHTVTRTQKRIDERGAEGAGVVQLGVLASDRRSPRHRAPPRGGGQRPNGAIVPLLLVRRYGLQRSPGGHPWPRRVAAGQNILGPRRGRPTTPPRRPASARHERDSPWQAPCLHELCVDQGDRR